MSYSLKITSSSGLGYGSTGSVGTQGTILYAVTVK